jgi:SAM-dependent methyltransferase
MFGLPLVMMERGKHAEARRRIYETTLNSADSVITREEVFADAKARRVLYDLEQRRLLLTLGEKGEQKRRFFSRLGRIVASRRAEVTGSAYSTYYEDKNEAFDPAPSEAWTAKQHGVHATLQRFKPRTVLDIGSNTGWFSKLAALLGSSVIAVDIDEASIDRLYRDAQRENLDIVPLVANLTAALPERYPNTFEDEPSLSLIGDGPPLLTGAQERLRCEMVMALALVHHLALGQGLSFDSIASTLSNLATSALCVEFVDMNDKMITSDPGFFPAWSAAPGNFKWYSRENFIAALRNFFQVVEVLPSHPHTRSLLVCSSK